MASVKHSLGPVCAYTLLTRLTYAAPYVLSPCYLHSVGIIGNPWPGLELQRAVRGAALILYLSAAWANHQLSSKQMGLENGGIVAQ